MPPAPTRVSEPSRLFLEQLRASSLADAIVVPGGIGDESEFDARTDAHLEAVAGQLLRIFREQDQVEAYVLLIELCQVRLHRVASGLTRQLALMIDPDDLVAAFMARLFTDVRKDQPEVRRFLSLAYTTMRFDALNQLRLLRRARARGQSYEERAAEQRTPIDPSHEVDAREQVHVLRRLGTLFLALASRCFHELGLRDRRVLLCREIEHMSYDQVAATLGVPRSQVGMILKRARERLADRIERALLAHPTVRAAPPAPAGRRSSAGTQSSVRPLNVMESRQ